MSAALLAPFGLAALAALVLPIVIHLIRRLALTTTDFAAMHWIHERISPRRRLRFERPWLLAIRLLLLAFVAVLLARPVIEAASGPSRSWVVVAPGADRSAARTVVSDVTAEWHWLAPGFPSIDVEAPGDAVPLASLLREIDADLAKASALTVIVPAEVTGLDGEHLRLRHAVDWHIVPGRMATSAITPSRTPTRLTVRYAPEEERSLVYLRAAVAAWNVDEPARYQLDAQPSSVPIGDDARWLVWLGPDPPAAVSAWIDHGGVALLTHHALANGDAFWRDGQGSALASIEPSGSGRVISLRGGLTPKELPILLDADFPSRLIAALRGPPLAPTRAPADAVKPMDDVGDNAYKANVLASARPLDPWLVVLIAALFLLERMVATRARSEVTA
jgi:hypothetical protein